MQKKRLNDEYFYDVFVNYKELGKYNHTFIGQQQNMLYVPVGLLGNDP